MEIKEIKNYQALTLLGVYSNLYKLSFGRDEFDDALIIATEGVSIEDAIKAYGKIEKGIKDSVLSLRDEKGKAPKEAVDKANSDLMELSNRTAKLNPPIGNTIAKYIYRIEIKPVEIRVMKDLGII